MLGMPAFVPVRMPVRRHWNVLQVQGVACGMEVRRVRLDIRFDRVVIRGRRGMEKKDPAVRPGLSSHNVSAYAANATRAAASSV